MGFHPDTFFYDYIFKDGDKKDQQAFTKYEAETLQEHINVCFGLCKKQKADIYAIALGQLDRFVTSSKNNNQPLGKTKHGQSQQFVVDYHPGLGDYLDEKKIRWFAHSNDQIGIFVKDASALFNIALDFHKWHSNVME